MTTTAPPDTPPTPAEYDAAAAHEQAATQRALDLADAHLTTARRYRRVAEAHLRAAAAIIADRDAHYPPPADA